MKKQDPRTAVGGEILQMVSMGMAHWLDMKGGRIVGLVDGSIMLAFDDKDWKKLYREFFKEETKNG